MQPDKGHWGLLAGAVGGISALGGALGVLNGILATVIALLTIALLIFKVRMWIERERWLKRHRHDAKAVKKFFETSGEE